MTKRMILAEQVKTWRGTLSACEAAPKLGIPQRTLEGIKQGGRSATSNCCGSRSARPF